MVLTNPGTDRSWCGTNGGCSLYGRLDRIQKTIARELEEASLDRLTLTCQGD